MEGQVLPATLSFRLSFRIIPYSAPGFGPENHRQAVAALAPWTALGLSSCVQSELLSKECEAHSFGIRGVCNS